MALLNPALPQEEKSLIEESLASLHFDRPHIFLTTSGSTGKRKLVALSYEAILTSAKSVNQFLQISKDDIWFQALPLFHIGGLSISARAFLSKSSVVHFQNKWSPSTFYKELEKSSATLCSLVPTQVYDLVNLKADAPKKLRAVLVGGGALSKSLYVEARKLGWQVLPTYGCSEASSQVATASLESLDLNTFEIDVESLKFPKMEVLPHLQVKEIDGQLAFKGDSLFSGYVVIESRKSTFIEGPKKNQWFVSDDLGQVTRLGEKHFVEIQGRSTFIRKVKGENVDFSKLNSVWQEVVMKKRASDPSLQEVAYSSCLIPFPDERSQFKVVLAIEKDKKKLEEFVEEYNDKVLPFEKIDSIQWIESLPRSELGKVQVERLVQELRAKA